MTSIKIADVNSDLAKAERQNLTTIPTVDQHLFKVELIDLINGVSLILRWLDKERLL